MFTGEGDLKFREDGGQWSDSCRVFIRLVNPDHCTCLIITTSPLILDVYFSYFSTLLWSSAPTGYDLLTIT